MLWYGYIYYFLFNILLLSFMFIFYRLTLLNTITRLGVISLFNRAFLSSIMFILSTSMLVLNNTITYYNDLVLIGYKSTINYMGYFFYDNLFPVNTINLNLIASYYYPFVYIFLFVTCLSIIFCLVYNTDELLSFMFYCLIIFASGYTLFFTDSLVIFFFAYEMLLVPSFFILYKFAKTRRCVEASYLMFFWTQFGAIFLIFAFTYLLITAGVLTFSSITLLYFTPFEVNFIFLCCFIGFGVKLPIWPFYGWLPKAHVEASTNFSIFLSGVLVKFAFFGLMKCLVMLQSEPTFTYVYPFLSIGIVDAIFKLFYQIDLKKLVAYSTVVEMHWLVICIVSGQSSLLLANFCMLISHALLSTNSFLIVDAIARRFKTRLITEISGLNFICPKLFLVSLLNLLIFLGFPGSIFFISEVLFFSFCFDMFPLLTLFLILFLYLLGPSFFFKSWVNVMFGKSHLFNSSVPLDLTSRELMLFLGIPFIMYWLGVSWQSFII